MSQSNSLIRNAIRDKRNFVCNKSGDLNRIVLYVGGDNIVYKHIYVQNVNNISDSGDLYTTDKTLKIESNKIIVSGNVCLTGASLGFSGDLNISCNGILNADGITYCDNSVIGNGTTYSFDFKSDKVLTLQGLENTNIVSKNRIYQDIPKGTNYGNYTGYYGLVKNTYPTLNNVNIEKVVSEWNTRITPINVTTWWRGICWAPELGIFVSTGYSGTGYKIMTSPDGINWTIRESNNYEWRSVCWSPELRLFVSVAYSGTGSGNRIMTSPNGINWTLRKSAADHFWRAICWSPELGLFVAVSETIPNNMVMISYDGINWTLTPSGGDNRWYGVCWSPELSLFVAVATSGNGNRVMTSSNGINWTTRITPKDNEWRSVCWSSKLGLFVSVANTGDGDRIMTSSDGITWILRNSPVDNNWTTIVWSPELSVFVAVAYTGPGIGNRVMTSYDGINWTIRTSNNNQWVSICWSSELGFFVACSQNGTQQIMTSSLKARPPGSYNTYDSPFNTIDQNGNWTIQQTLKQGTYTSGSTTPSVSGANLLYISNTLSTTITDFTNGSSNQRIVLVFFDSNTIIQNNSNIKLRGSIDFTSAINNSLTLLYTGTLWVEISRSINPV